MEEELIRNIKSEIVHFEGAVKIYQKDYEENTGGKSEFWKGKSEAYKYTATRLKRILEWNEIN